MADNQAASHYPPSNQPKAPSAVNPASESEYLQQQADLAMRAMKKTIADAQAKLAKGLSLNAVAKDHPWATVAASAVAGFAAGAVITPNKRDAALKRLAEIERALHPTPPGAPVAGVAADGQPGKASSLGGTLLREVFALAKPVLLNGVTAMMAAHTAANSASEQTAEANANAPRADSI